MGYYTRYDISNNSPEVKQAINEISGYNDVECDEIKWYQHKDHCTQVSKMFPDELITVDGEGEEQGDQWRAYYKDGKSQYCKAIITFEPFDESKLK